MSEWLYLLHFNQGTLNRMLWFEMCVKMHGDMLPMYPTLMNIFCTCHNIVCLWHFFSTAFFKKLEYSCFTVSCFCCTAKWISCVVYTYPLFNGLASQSGHHKAFSTVPCAIRSVLILICFLHSISSVYTSIPVSQVIPPVPPFALGVLTFVFYICVSVSALQMRLSIPFF